MGKWLRRLRGAIGMGFVWGLAWGIGGLMIGVASILLPGLPWDAVFEVFDAPLPALALPGFVGGGFFSLVLSTAGRRRRFSELSLGKFALYGAVGGVLLTLFPLGLAAVGLATIKPGALIPILFAGIPIAVLSAGSAVGSLMIARRGEDRQLGAGREGPKAIGP